MSSISSQQSSSSKRARFFDRRLYAAMWNRPPPYEIPNCFCGIPMQMKTSYTPRHLCRRFGICATNTCNCWTWLDHGEVPSYARDSMNIFIRKYEELSIKNENLRSRIHGEKNEIWKKHIQEKDFLLGIFVGFMMSSFLVIISKEGNWELTAPWTGVKIQVPVKFIVGDLDLTYNTGNVKDYIHKGDFKRDVPFLFCSYSV